MYCHRCETNLLCTLSDHSFPFLYDLIFFVLLPNPGETESERREKLRQQRAEIARCWIKYCLNLLQDAKKQLEVDYTVVVFVWVFEKSLYAYHVTACLYASDFIMCDF